MNICTAATRSPTEREDDDVIWRLEDILLAGAGRSAGRRTAVQNSRCPSICSADAAVWTQSANGRLQSSAVDANRTRLLRIRPESVRPRGVRAEAKMTEDVKRVCTSGLRFHRLRSAKAGPVLPRPTIDRQEIDDCLVDFACLRTSSSPFDAFGRKTCWSQVMTKRA